MFWKSTLPVGFWYGRELADPQLGQLQERESNDPVAQPLVWVLGAMGLIPDSATVSQWAGPGVALSLFPNCSLHGIIILKPQPICSKMLHIT